MPESWPARLGPERKEGYRPGLGMGAAAATTTTAAAAAAVLEKLLAVVDMVGCATAAVAVATVIGVHFLHEESRRPG